MLIPKAHLISAVIVCLLIACTPPATQEESATTSISVSNPAPQQLQRLFADEWASRLKRDPLFASSMGVNDYNDLLPNMAAVVQQGFLDEDRGFLERLMAIDSAELSQEDKTNYDLFNFVIDHRSTLAQYRPYRIPFLSDAGFHMRIQRMYESMPFKTVEDYDQYLLRLRAVGPFFTQNIENMRDGLADGFTQPKVILEGIVPSISGAIVDDPEDSVFFAPFHATPPHFSTEDSERLRSEGRNAIAEIVMPAYNEFLRFFIK